MVTLEATTQDVGRSEDIDYRWTQVAGPSVGTLTGSLPNFKTPDEITALAFELIVTSKGGQSEPDQVVFVVVDDPSSAFFVRADGNDEDAGTPANPLATLQTAINKAGDKGGGSVYVAGGKYAGSLSLVDGVSIYGGFDPNTWLRDSTRHITEIQGGETAVRGIRVRALSLDALTIRSVDASEPGGSSIALNLSASTGIVVNASRLIAGDGARGSDGANGKNGANGQNGAKGTDQGWCSPSKKRFGGKGGGGKGRAGGTGGTGGVFDGFAGSDGQGARGGGKGLGGNTYKTGGRGANGAAVATASMARAVSHLAISPQANTTVAKIQAPKVLMQNPVAVAAVVAVVVPVVQAALALAAAAARALVSWRRRAG